MRPFCRVNKVCGGGRHSKNRFSSISILDMFGFEDCHENGLEQLCINYSAEILQQHFNKVIEID